MFIDVKELAQHKIQLHKSYAPGTLDLHSGEFRQIEPLEVRAKAELLDDHIHLVGDLHTRLEMVCARCLEPVVEDISRDFDLMYKPLTTMTREEEFRLKTDDTEIGFFEGDGLFLADVLAEQVILALPIKVICRSDCRGLCPQCGANLNGEDCRCEAHTADPRLAVLGKVKQNWQKKH